MASGIINNNNSIDSVELKDIETNNNSYSPLELLASELIFKIISYLNVNDVLAMNLQSKNMLAIANDEQIWKVFVEKKFGSPLPKFLPEKSDYRSSKEYYSAVRKKYSDDKLFLYKLGLLSKIGKTNKEFISDEFNKLSIDTQEKLKKEMEVGDNPALKDDPSFIATWLGGMASGLLIGVDIGQDIREKT